MAICIYMDLIFFLIRTYIQQVISVKISHKLLFSPQGLNASICVALPRSTVSCETNEIIAFFCENRRLHIYCQ